MIPAQFLLNNAIKFKRMGLDYRLISLYLINPQNRPANEFEQYGSTLHSPLYQTL
jgi:hypothetical protein